MKLQVLILAAATAMLGPQIIGAQDAPSAQSASSATQSQVAYLNNHFELTGISVSKDFRLFVNFPRWSDRYLNAIVEVDSDGTEKPFPNTEWNRWDGKPQTAGTHFVCVQSVVVDKDNALWVVDAGAPLLTSPVPNGPKLVRIDLTTNQVVQVIRFPSTVALPDSYLNDIRIDNSRGFAYLTDSGHGGIVVVNFGTAQSWRKLDGNPSVLGNPNVPVVVSGQTLKMANGKPAMFNSDSIALSNDGNTLYYKPINATTLWSVATDVLRDQSANASIHIRTAATNLFPTDGLWLDSKGRIYLSDVEHFAVRRLTIQTGSLETVFQSPSLVWPDTFTEDPSGNIYITASRLNQQPRYHQGYSTRDHKPYEVFRLLGLDPQ